MTGADGSEVFFVVVVFLALVLCFVLCDGWQCEFEGSLKVARRRSFFYILWLSILNVRVGAKRRVCRQCGGVGNGLFQLPFIYLGYFRVNTVLLGDLFANLVKYFFFVHIFRRVGFLGARLSIDNCHCKGQSVRVHLQVTSAHYVCGTLQDYFVVCSSFRRKLYRGINVRCQEGVVLNRNLIRR